MQLHFYTRDIHLDYPRIGWIPRLPEGADALWMQFSGCHAGEYPEVLLSQRNGQWQLYLSAINSGRTDSPTAGNGRIIRISLYLTGQTGEDSSSVIGLISQFLNESLRKEKVPHLLQNLFQSRIQPGDPEKWAARSDAEQKTFAADLLKGLSAFPSVTAGSPQYSRWIGGCEHKEAIDLFIESSNHLLTGAASGMALSLSFLSASDVPKMLAGKDTGDMAAVLLTALDDRSHPVKEMPFQYPDPVPRSKKEPQTGSENPFLHYTLKAFVMLLVFLFIIGKRSCNPTPPPKDSEKPVTTSKSMPATGRQTNPHEPGKEIPNATPKSKP